MLIICNLYSRNAVQTAIRFIFTANTNPCIPFIKWKWSQYSLSSFPDYLLKSSVQKTKIFNINRSNEKTLACENSHSSLLQWFIFCNGNSLKICAKKITFSFIVQRNFPLCFPQKVFKIILHFFSITFNSSE